jgi:hypothetical protein
MRHEPLPPKVTGQQRETQWCDERLHAPLSLNESPNTTKDVKGGSAMRFSTGMYAAPAAAANESATTSTCILANAN